MTAPAETVEPLVSCIMPTANRSDFVGRAVDSFLRQDYERRELIIIDDGEHEVGDLIPWDERIHYGRVRERLSLGTKRNLACERARGAFIAHWDDDDWYATWRLSYQVGALARRPEVAVCGLATMLFYDPAASRAWRYTWGGDYPWVYGATMCYRRTFWERGPFPDVSEGEDTVFVRAATGRSILPLDRSTFYVGIIHSGNTSVKQTTAPDWSRCSEDVVRQTIDTDWPSYHQPHGNVPRR